MRKAILAFMLLVTIMLSSNVMAGYGYPYGGSYSNLHYPNSYYDVSFSYWNNNGPYVSVNFLRSTPYTYQNYSYSGCNSYWCYQPAPYYYRPYYNSYNYGSYRYNPGYQFSYNW